MKLRKFIALSLVLGSLCMFGSASQAQNIDVPLDGTKVLHVKPEKTQIKYIPDVVYSQVPSRGYQNVALTMDILQPQSKERMPAIVYIPGGGFINANKANNMQERMQVAGHGYVTAGITYRVAPGVQMPAPLEDVKAAVRYLRANAAKFNIDPDRIGVIGGSAGGYLAAMAAATNGLKQFDVGENLQVSSDIKCAVDLYGLSDLTKIGADYNAEVQKAHRSPGATEALWVNGSAVFGGRDGGILAHKEAADAANPINYIHAQSAPMLLMHGTADTVVSPSQTDILYQALKAKHIPAERYLIPNAKHGGQYWVQDDVQQVIIDFFDNYLKQ